MRAPAADTPAWPLRLVVALCFFATGGASLVYEIVWSRQLSLLMGNTAYTLATLLTVFMGGLALGAWLARRWRGSPRASLRMYGLLELAVGAWCLALPWMLAAVEPLFGAIYRAHYSSLPVFNLLQFLVVALLLIVPTTAMGATLPVLVHFASSKTSALSRTIGLFYAMNSAGAFAGALTAGLVLLPAVGLSSTYRVALLINALVGLVALLLARSAAPEAEPPQPLATGVAGRRLLLAGFGACGFAAMVYQVAWTRTAALALGSSTYAFTLIAAAFILGLSLGSLLLGWMGDRRWGPLAAGLLAAGIGFSALATVGPMGSLPIEVTRLIASAPDFAALEAGKFRAVVLLLLVPTLCMGGLLPVVSRCAARASDGAAAAVGAAYGANALGTILGSFCAGFVLIPLIGMRQSILLAAGLNVLVGAAFLLRDRRWKTAALLPLAGGAMIAAAPRWDRSVLISDPTGSAEYYVSTGQETNDDLRRVMQREVLSFEEGPASLVAVTKGSDGLRYLFVDGRVDATSFGYVQSWLGHLPLLLRPQARRVLVVGLGSGHTVASVEAHAGVQGIDCVELSPEVARAARDFFHPYTANALDDPRLNLVIGDGRLHLRHTDRLYDVILSQPSNPWVVGASAMFTRECFEAMRARLAPGGLACAWIQGYRVPPQTFRVLAQTWRAVWPHVSLWTSQEAGAFLFVGGEDPLAIDFDAFDAAYRDPKLLERMQWGDMPRAANALSHLVAVDDGLAAIAGDAPINTDDNARIEFDTPRGLFREQLIDVLELIHAQRVDPWDYVQAEGEASPYFRANRELGKQLRADQDEVVAVLRLPAEQRRPVLQRIMDRNPSDAFAFWAYGEP